MTIELMRTDSTINIIAMDQDERKKKHGEQIAY